MTHLRLKKHNTSIHRRILRDLSRNWKLYVIMLPILTYYVLFRYFPMSKMVIAFQDYNIFRGISGSPFVGFDNFVKFFKLRTSGRLITNTLALSALSIIFEFPSHIIFALMINEVKNSAGRRTMQTISYMPHFISLVVVAGVIMNFVSSNGVINTFLSLLNPYWTNVNLLDVPEYYRAIHISSSIWQTMGWGSIIYLATLSGIDPQLYEAAYIDGATKLRRLWHITIPSLIPIIVVKLIMRVGSIMDVNTQKILLLYNPLTYSTADTISTYMYRYGLLGKNYSVGAAIGVFNSIISIVLLVSVNAFSRRVSESSLW